MSLEEKMDEFMESRIAIKVTEEPPEKVSQLVDTIDFMCGDGIDVCFGDLVSIRDFVNYTVNRNAFPFLFVLNKAGTPTISACNSRYFDDGPGAEMKQYSIDEFLADEPVDIQNDLNSVEDFNSLFDW